MVRCGSSFYIRIAWNKCFEIQSINDLTQNYRLVSFSEEIQETWWNEEILHLIVRLEHGLKEMNITHLLYWYFSITKRKNKENS